MCGLVWWLWFRWCHLSKYVSFKTKCLGRSGTECLMYAKGFMGYQGKHAGYMWIVRVLVCMRAKRPISARAYSGFCSFRTDYKHVSAYATLHSNPNLKTGTRKLKIPDEALLLPVEIKVLYQCKYRHIFNSRT